MTEEEAARLWKLGNALQQPFLDFIRFTERVVREPYVSDILSGSASLATIEEAIKRYREGEKQAYE